MNRVYVGLLVAIKGLVDWLAGSPTTVQQQKAKKPLLVCNEFPERDSTLT